MIVSRHVFSANFLFLLAAIYTSTSHACTDGCVLQSVTNLPTMRNVSVVAVGDVNNDGRLDIVAVGEYNDGSINIFLQAADGTMQPPITYFRDPNDPTYVMGNSVGIGDLNGDGLNDIAVTTAGANAGIRVLFQNSQGTFSAFRDYPTSAPNKLRVVDINGDGRLDIVAAGGGLSVFLQNASGSLDGPRLYAVDGGRDLEIGDLNNDGRPDAVVLGGGGTAHHFAVLLQNAAGDFQNPVYYDLPNNPSVEGVGIGDVNGDGRSDLVVTDSESAQIAVYTQNAAGALNAPVFYNSGDIGRRPMAVDVVDMNQDGRADVVVLTQYGSVLVHLQNPDGTLAPEIGHHSGHTSTFPNPHALTVRDLNADGKPDVVAATDFFLSGVDVHYATRANLSMTLTADQSSGLVGKPIRYTATITNDGPDVATDVRFAHTTPSGMFYTGLIANSQGICDDNRRTCALGAMAVGQSATVVFEAFVPSQPGTYTVSASIVAYAHDSNTADNTLSVTTGVTSSADLGIYSHSVFSPASGQIAYSVVVVNYGASAAQDVTIADTLPPGVTPLSASWSETFGGTRSGSCQISGAQVQCAVGALRPTDIFAGAYPIVMNIRCQVMTGDNLLNVASVSAVTGDPDTRNNTSARLSTAQGSAIEQPPVISFAGPTTVRAGAAAVLDARGTRDPEGTRVSFQWDFHDGSRQFGDQARFTFTSAGPAPITIRATDENGAVGTQTFQVTAVNIAPVAVASGPYYLASKNSQINAHARRSYDVDGGQLGYAWDFGDGGGGTGDTVFHTYTRSGEFPVRVTVFDGAASSVAGAKAIVFNIPPYANAGARYEVQKNQPVYFDGSYSSDGNGDPLTYRWNFGDGTTGGGVKPVHTYAHGGVYNVTLIVNDGEVDSAPAAAAATVVNHVPIANGGGPYNAVKNQAVALDGSASSDADNDTLTYRWNFGDGATGSGVNPTHVYTKNGRFALELVVNDGDVDSATYRTTVDVKNR